MVVRQISYKNNETNEMEYVNNKISLTINDNITLHLECIHEKYATLYFTNALQNIIDIPDEIMVYIYDYINKNFVVLKRLPKTKNYELSNTDNYKVIYNDKFLMNIHTKHIWEIST